MTTLQVVAIIVSMGLSAFGIVFATGRLVGKLSAHEELDQVRFGTLTKMWEEVRDDVREIRNMASRRRGD